MKNIQVKDGKIYFDCTAKECATPGEPHSIPLSEFLAAFKTLVEEFGMIGDPRLSAISVALHTFVEKLGIDKGYLNAEEVKEAYGSMQEKIDKLHSLLRGDLELESEEDGSQEFVTPFAKPPKYLN